MSQTKRFVTVNTLKGGGASPPSPESSLLTGLWGRASDTLTLHTQKFSQKKDPRKKPQKKIDRFMRYVL